MSEDMVKQIIDIIKKHMYLDYSSGYTPKLILDVNGLSKVESDLEKFVKNYKNC